VGEPLVLHVPARECVVSEAVEHRLVGRPLDDVDDQGALDLDLLGRAGQSCGAGRLIFDGAAPRRDADDELTARVEDVAALVNRLPVRNLGSIPWRQVPDR